MKGQALGIAWREPTKGKDGKFHFNARLDMGGMIPALLCRIVENSPDAKRKNEDAPDYLMFFSPSADEEGLKVGAFWEKTAQESGAPYLSGTIEVRKFGKVRHPGGAETNFTLAGDPIRAKLCAYREPQENGPTHLLLPWTQKRRGSAGDADPGAASAPEVEDVGAEEFEEQEA